MSDSRDDVFVHESSYVDEPCEIGAGTRIWHFAHVMKDCRIGRDCNIGQNVFVAAGAVVGDNCKIQNNVSVYEGVVLEDDVFCGPSMVFTNVSTPRSHVCRRGQYEPTRVCRGATIGANATIVCGHTIGRFAFIGAGTVVTRDVPAHALVVGNPGVQIGWMCACGVRLPLAVDADERPGACPECGAAYRVDDGALTPVDWPRAPSRIPA